MKSIPQSSLATPLTPADLEVSRLYWIRSVQSAYFSSELTIIASGAHLSKSHPLAKFTAFIDHSGILRIGGRLRHSQLDPECKHSAILPRDSYLSRLIISDAHLRTLHGGTQGLITPAPSLSKLGEDEGLSVTRDDTSLKRLFNSGSKEFLELTQLLTHDGTTWVFNPPAAPYFGGKWEAAVKSVKHHLRRTIGETALTYKEITTLLVQIEAVLNSRPLCPLSDDPEDLAPLTLGHFVIGAAPTTIPEPSLSAVPL
ncbi:uncharacterized protein [Polyergus mexicanus]|uniref:uncharacterized protein n=1 Tax=Polyergus mexicanus TaxID=615972 RepID=UPI0038B51F34